MNQTEFNKIVSGEQQLHNFVGIILPMIVFILLYFIYYAETGDNLPLHTWLPILAYLAIFLIIYERKFFFARIKAKTSEYFFEQLSSEQAVIRFEYIEKFQKYSIIVLIIIVVFVSVGIFLIMNERNMQLEEYYSQQEAYEQEIKNTYNLTEKGLREYLHKQISEMSTLKVGQRIVTIFGNELLEKNEDASYADFLTPGNQFLWNVTSDIDRRQFLHEKYAEMTFDELKEIHSKQLMKLEPSPVIYGINDNTLIEFLIFISSIPFIQVYVVLPLKYSLTKYADFYYFISKGCFNIAKLDDLDQITKRKYLLMGLNYYEKFVKKNTNLNINKFDQIKSACVSPDSNHITRLAYNFVSCLEKDDHMELLSFIQNKIQVFDNSQFLIYISLATKIKENWHIITAVVSTLIGLLPLFLKIPSPS